MCLLMCAFLFFLGQLSFVNKNSLIDKIKSRDDATEVSHTAQTLLKHILSVRMKWEMSTLDVEYCTFSAPVVVVPWLISFSLRV